MIRCVEYSGSYALQWDALVRNSRNGTFLFLRNYMDYHHDRFTDASLVFVDAKGHFVALMPANYEQSSRAVYSHKGLTYGGLILSKNICTEQIGEAMQAAIEHYRGLGAERMFYRPTPYIYNIYPSDEPLFFLFRHNAKLVARNLSQAIYLPEAIKANTLRRRMLKKSVQAGNHVCEEHDVTAFWHILDHTLQVRHNVKPVHSIDELHLLMSRFPEQIRLFVTKDPSGTTLAGTVVYDCGQVVHTQYLAASDEGRTCGALDQVIEHLMTNIYHDRRYFDFGVSTEHAGLYLNTGLTFQKESFGARGVCYDTWELNLLKEMKS